MKLAFTWRRVLILVLLVGALGFGVGDRLVSSFQNSPSSEKEVAKLADLVGLRPGMQVAEIGAGDGRMAVAVAKRIASSGCIYATELEAGQLEQLRQAASAAGVTNLLPVQAKTHSAALPEECCDVIYMRRVYHHLSNLPAILKSLNLALRPGGRLVIIDFKSPGWRFYRPHGIAKREVISGLRAAGFHLEREEGAWSRLDYFLVFRKTQALEVSWIGRSAP